MFLLNGFSKSQIDRYNYNSNIYYGNKKTNWYTLDIENINEIRSIDYLFLSSINNKGNLKSKIKLLKNNYKWKKIIFSPNFKNTKEITLLKRE